MKKHHHRASAGRSSPTLTLVAALVILAGCGGTPESEPKSQAAVANEDPAAISGFLDAAFEGKMESVRAALEADVDVNAADEAQRTALQLAAFNGHSSVVKLLLEKGALLSHRDAAGRTALMFASTGSNAETVELLLDAGAEVNAVDTGEKFTPLMHAAAEGQVEVVQALLKHGADPSLRDLDGDTARDFATRNGHAEVVRLLTN